MSSVTDSIVINLIGDWNRPVISNEQYDDFQRLWLLYILQDKRYGQAFCEHFSVGNATPLYHFTDETISRRWIKDNYLQQ